MSLLLPPQDSPLRDFFSMSDLLSLGTAEGRRALPTLAQARLGARRTFEADRNVRGVHAIVATADGKVKLVRFGPRGGTAHLWTFGEL